MNGKGQAEAIKWAYVIGVKDAGGARPDAIPINDGRGSAVFWDRNARMFIPREAVAGAVVRRPAEPRQYTAGTLEDFVRLVKDLATRVHQERRTEPERKPQVLVLVSRERVVAFLDEADRHDRVTMDLRITPTWSRLAGMQDAPWKGDQRAFRALLRTELDVLISDPPDLLSIAAKLRFKSGSEGAASVDVGKYAVSRSTAAEISGSGDLPETVTVKAVMWSNLHSVEWGVDRAIRLSLDLDPVSAEFSLRTKAGEIERGENWLNQAVRDEIIARMVGEAESPLPYDVVVVQGSLLQ